MNVSRRGFLHTMMAAAVGAVASLDTKTGLWVPGAAPSSEPLIATVADIPVAKVADEILELNDLALQFAQRMGEYLRRHGRFALVQEVLFKEAGGVLPSHGYLLDLQERGRGFFRPHRGRTVATIEAGKTRDALLNEARSRFKIPYEVDMFVPISGELRPGVAFTADVKVGVATDPETGMSARVLKYHNYNGYQTVPVLGFEMAGGRWHPTRKRTWDSWE